MAKSSQSKSIVASWKPLGTLRVLFGTHGTLECIVSASTSLFADVIQPPTTLALERMVSCSQRDYKKEFMLESSSIEKDGIHMGTLYSLLLATKSALLLSDVQDSSRQYLLHARSTNTASLTEYCPSTRRHSKGSSKPTTMSSSQTNDNVSVSTVEKKKTPVQESPSETKPTAPIIEAVPLSELKRLYQAYIDTVTPEPGLFCQQAVMSINDSDWFKEFIAVLPQCSDRRLLELQVGLRLVFSLNEKFVKFHHALVYQSASKKKHRKRLKKSSPQQVLQDQVVSLLSLLAIQCKSPAVFKAVVRDMIGSAGTRLCLSLKQVIYDSFELNDDNDDEVSTMPNATVAAKSEDDSKKLATTSSSSLTITPPKQESPQETTFKKKDDLMSKSVALVSSKKSKNSLVSNLKPKYVGSHFGTKLSNISTLFHQVKTKSKPVMTKSKTISTKSKKRPSITKILPVAKRSKVSETPARVLPTSRVSETPARVLPMASPFSSSTPMGRPHNARFVAQAALKASRRKL